MTEISAKKIQIKSISSVGKIMYFFREIIGTVLD